MRKTQSKTFSLKSRTTSLVLALMLILSAASVGFATLASAVAKDDSGGLAATGAGITVNVADGTGDNYKADSDKAFWVDATYFDYYSDEEMSGSNWLKPKQAGTGYDSDDDWFTFETFNGKLSSYANTQKMKYPLYFGNFCNTVVNRGSYIDSAYQFTIQNSGSDRNTIIEKDHKGPYSRVTDGLYNYEYFINNSNALTNNHDAVMGLASNSLDSAGDILTPTNTGTVKMPYFNQTWLESNSAAKTLNSYFPFRQTTTGNVTTYSFDSTNATDNVFFNWNGTNPISVAYGQGTNFGVHDGLYNFMGPGYTAGYGIFPFNRANEGNGGNNNLDYGFGIKMNMDFRVPENGKIGTDDVKFKYSGDDDLWVYITPYKADGTLDTANSYLALDLGGNHKQAQGEINFSTMKSTVTTNAVLASSNVKYKSDTVYVALSDGWSDVNIWAWDDYGNNGHWVNKTKASFQESGKDVYAFKLSDFNGCYHFTTVEYTNWTGKRATNEGKNLNCVIHSQLGNVCWADNPNWIEPKYPADGQYTGLANITYATTAQKTKTLNGGQTLDPDQTYRMTIFYMERGMIESNCQMSFTMTPVLNDFKVKKTVNTANVNTGLQSALQQTDFSFTTTENGAVSKNTKYILNGETKSVNSSTGAYALKHDEVADFINQHATGSTLKVNEAAQTGALTYTTTWNVVDNSNNGAVIQLKNGSNASGTGLSTGEFELLNPQNASAPANLQANFVNTPAVAPLQITKTVVDESDTPITPGDEFTFTVGVDLSGGTNYQAYNLAYTTGSTAKTATSGSFTLKAGETAVFAGIPKGATYRVTETPAAGYKAKSYTLNGTTSAITGAATITSTVGNSNTLTIVNQPGQATASFEVEKYLRSNGANTQYKNGTLFRFDAEGLKNVPYATGSTSADATAMTRTGVTVDANGKAVFANNNDSFLKFTQAGVYIFKVTEESAINGSTADIITDNDNLLTYKHDITASTQQFLVKFTVTANGSDLTVSPAEYYKYNGGTITANTFAASNKVDTPQFVNEVKTGKITINKKDGGNAALQGVEFKLYRKDGSNEVLVDTLTTNAQGVATKDGLDIYQKDGSFYTANPSYQEYVLKETKTKDGYMQEDTVYTFSFPTYDSTAGALKYEYTFDYVNGAIKQPEAGGFSGFNYLLPGIALIILSFAAIGLYIARMKKKQTATVHTPRFMD